MEWQAPKTYIALSQDNAAPNRMRHSTAKGQAMVEFIFAVGAALIVMSMAIALYVQDTEAAARFSDTLEAKRICFLASTQISTAAAVRGNASVPLNLPIKLNGLNYTVWAAPSAGSVRVDWSGRGVSCSMPRMRLANSSGSNSTFAIIRNATITSNGGSVVVTP